MPWRSHCWMRGADGLQRLSPGVQLPLGSTEVSEEASVKPASGRQLSSETSTEASPDGPTMESPALPSDLFSIVGGHVAVSMQSGSGKQAVVNAMNPTAAMSDALFQLNMNAPPESSLVAVTPGPRGIR